MAAPLSIQRQGLALRLARIVLERSQREIAESAGLSQMRLHHIEAGVRKASQDELQKIWTALSSEGA